LAYTKSCKYSSHKNALKEKKCIRCSLVKPIINFGAKKNVKTNAIYYSSYCRECEALNTLEYKRINRVKARIAERRSQIRRYGIDPERYEEINNNQDGKCAICGCDYSIERKGKKCRLAIDHDHSTGAVRGLLCSKCNTGIGCLFNIELLSKAISYLACGKDWRK
jgi:hypothetical protein